MGTSLYRDGRLIERSDDITRTVTMWDATGTLIPSTPDAPNPRPYTDTENAATDAAAVAAAKAAVAAQLQADTTADLDKLRQSIDALAVLLADDTTVGSIRATIGPTAATAGTGSLRALKAQTNANVVLAASIKALIDRCIDLGKCQIDDAQATRRIARQTLRLARQMVGDFPTADVGSDI